jgi:hypothetical protein
VSAARADAGVDATEVAQAYLAGLLTDFAQPDPAYEETLERPLTLLLLEAKATSGAERFERLRVLGDGVLFLSGFFPEHFLKRGVEPKYLTSLGSQAYSGAAEVLARGGTELDVFRELAEEFRSFVRLLSTVSELLAMEAQTSASTVMLYERWLKTGSETAARGLRARGLVPTRNGRTLH